MLSSEVVCYRVFDEFVCSVPQDFFFKTNKQRATWFANCLPQNHRRFRSPVHHWILTTSRKYIPDRCSLKRFYLHKIVGRKNRTQVKKFSRGSNRKRVTQGSWHMPWRPTSRPPMIPPFGGRPRRRARCFGELWKQLKSQGYRMWL